MMSLIQYEPWSMLRHIKDDVDTLFQNNLLTTGKNLSSFLKNEIWPEVDIEEQDKCYIVKANLPGMEAKDLDVNFGNGLLTLSGEVSSEHKEKGKNFICTERTSGSFSRQFNLEGVSDDAKIIAKFKNGVLNIEIPKNTTSGRKNRKIEVKSE